MVAARRKEIERDSGLVRLTMVCRLCCNGEIEEKRGTRRVFVALEVRWCRASDLVIERGKGRTTLVGLVVYAAVFMASFTRVAAMIPAMARRRTRRREA
ncbi:hypothetical protein HAX54_008793 [Datura stramonium]|uniref:Transmembrane protein n=1 Tax=Datura stramonium TaxID=4076 RepID=A0ABS8TGF3_DATST|nr:hypothetical protein [Datura stramonium]